jgi:hypothetical protein
VDDESVVGEPTDCRAEIARLRDEVDEWRRELRDQIGDVEWRLATLAFAVREPRRFGLDALLIAMHQTTEQIGQTKVIIAHGLQYLATGHPPDQSGRRETHAQLIASATKEGYDPTEVAANLAQRPGSQAERLFGELLETNDYSGLDGLVRTPDRCPRGC